MTTQSLGFQPARLVSARRAAGLSQRQLADATGIPQGHVSRIESGKLQPSLARLARLAVALGVSTDYLLGL